MPSRAVGALSRGGHAAAQDGFFRLPLMERVGAAAHFAYSCLPQLPRQQDEKLLQVAVPVAGTGADDAAHHPAEGTHDGGLAHPMLSRVLRSQQCQRLSQPGGVKGIVSERLRGRLLHAEPYYMVRRRLSIL